VSARCLRRSFRHAQARRRPAGGTWYPLAGALKNILERRVDGLWVQVLPGGGVANVKAVEIGRADIALANSVSTVDAINGEPPFKACAPKVCNLATLYPQYFQVVTLESAGIGDPAQFRGRWLATQPKGNIGEAMTLHLLRAYDMSYAALSRLNYGNYTDSVALMQDGNAEIFTLGTSIPSGAVMDLASARAIRLVEIPDDGLRRMQAISTSSFPPAPTRDSGDHRCARRDLPRSRFFRLSDRPRIGLATRAPACGGAGADQARRGHRRDRHRVVRDRVRNAMAGCESSADSLHLSVESACSIRPLLLTKRSRELSPLQRRASRSAYAVHGLSRRALHPAPVRPRKK